MTLKDLIKKYWFFSLLIPVVYGSTFLGGISPTATLDGRVLTFAYSENKNDSLAIYLEQKDFNIPVAGHLATSKIAPPGFSIIYFAVKNNSGQDQTISVASTASNISLISIKQWGTIVGSTTIQAWLDQPISNTKDFISERPVLGSKTYQSSGFFIPKGDVGYFKGMLKYQLYPGQTDEFYLEAKGTNAYGHSY